jgi:hypothetical protein
MIRTCLSLIIATVAKDQYFDFEDDIYCHFPQSLFSLGHFSLLLKQSSGLLISYRFYGCDE